MANKATLQRLKLDPYFSKTIETNLNVWSHDQNSYEIKFEFYDHQCNKPIDLTGADMRILLDHEGSQPKIYPLEVESKVLGLAKFIMPEQIRGCEGKFTAHIYADYPNKTHDFGSFTFYTQLSRIDGDLGGCMDEIYVSEFEAALEDIKKFKVDIDKNISDMKEHFDGRYNEAKTDVKEIETLIQENNVATKNELGNLDDFREFDKDVISKIKNEFTERGINVKWFGAKGDGTTDDTDAINNAIKYGRETNNSVVIAPGTYLIKAHVDNQTVGNYLRNEGGIEMLDGTTLVIEHGAKLKAIVNDKKAYNVIRAHRKEDWTIILNGVIEGDAEEHTGTVGEWGYGISVQGGKNFKIIGSGIVHKCWGDGLNLQRAIRLNEELSGYYPENGTISGITSDANGRQGISIEEGKNILVKNCVFSNTYRIAPKFGVCIEPAWRNEKDRPVCEKITIDNCELIGNEGGGITIVGTTINDDIQVEDINITNCRFRDNKQNATLKTSTAVAANRCDVNVSSCTFSKNQSLYIASCRNVKLTRLLVEDGTLIALTDKTDKYDVKTNLHLSDSVITNDNITNTYKSVLTFILKADNILVSGNTIKQNSQDVELIRFTGEDTIQTETARLINNTLIGGRTTIKHTWVKRINITGNFISDNVNRCLESNGRDITFINNNILNSGKGIFCECHPTETSKMIVSDNLFEVLATKVFTAYQPNVNFTLVSLSNNMINGNPFTELSDIRNMNSKTLADLNGPKISTFLNSENKEELPVGSLYLDLNTGQIMYKSFDGFHKLTTTKILA